MDMNKLVTVYLKIRDARHDLKKKFDEEDAGLKKRQEVLESEFLKFLQASGMEAIKTEGGTIYRQEDVTPTAADWQAIYRFVVENDAFEMLEKRLKKTFVKEYMETHEGAIPPGVSIYREYVARVRRV